MQFKFKIIFKKDIFSIIMVCNEIKPLAKTWIQLKNLSLYERKARGM